MIKTALRIDTRPGELETDQSKRGIRPREVFRKGPAAPNLIRRMPMTEGQEANGADGIEESHALAVDSKPGRRLIHRESAIQHRLAGRLENHVGEIAVPIAEHRASIVEDARQPIAGELTAKL